MELMEGGELFDRISREEFFTEETAATYMMQVFVTCILSTAFDISCSSDDSSSSRNRNLLSSNNNSSSCNSNRKYWCWKVQFLIYMISLRSSKLTQCAHLHGNGAIWECTCHSIDTGTVKPYDVKRLLVCSYCRTTLGEIFLYVTTFFCPALVAGTSSLCGLCEGITRWLKHRFETVFIGSLWSWMHQQLMKEEREVEYAEEIPRKQLQKVSLHVTCESLKIHAVMRQTKFI